MSYTVKIPDNAGNDVLKHRMSGRKSILEKIDNLLVELEKHPRAGTGHPKPLGNNRQGQWVRHVTAKHRLVYEIDDEKMTVIILSAWGHYDDK